MPFLKRSETSTESPSLTRTNGWQRWKPLVLKELRETLRDTRTIGTLFLMPLLVYPLISLLMQNFIPREVDPETTSKFQIGLDSETTLDYLREKLGLADDSLRKEQLLWRTQSPRLEVASPEVAVEPEQLPLGEQSWSILAGSPEYKKYVSDGAVDLVLKLRAPPETEPNAEPILEMIYDPSREYSRAAANYIALRIERFNLMQAHTKLAIARGPPLRMLTRMEIAVQPTAVAAVSFATLIPLILIMMTITGAVYPAIDLTAGERERGTLESLMAAPVPRVGILAAKYVAVWTVAMLTASLNVISMLVTIWVLKLDTVFLGADGISLAMVGQVFGLLGLFAFFFSAILLVVTSAARSFKEAQAYLIPLMMLSLTPGALALMPNLKAELWMSFVPMVNLVVLSRDVMLGAVDADFAWLSIVSTLLYSVAALSLAAQVFGSDAVLYGSQGSWRELLQRNRTQLIPSPAFGMLVLALLFPTQFVMLGVLGRLQPQATALWMVGAMAVFTIILFLVLPVAAVLGRGFALIPTFALRRPSWSAACGGVLLGVGLWPLVALSLWLLSNWRAWMLGTEATAWSNQVVQLALQQTSGWAELPKPVLVLCLAIVPAVCEEWFFRGLLLQSLRQKNRDWVAIVLSGLAFGLFHFVVESSVAPLRFFVTAALGMVLAWVCLRSGSLWPGILLHAINNGILTSLALSREALQAAPPTTTVVASVLGGCLVSLVVGIWLVSRSRTVATHPLVDTGLVLLLAIFLSQGTTAAQMPTNRAEASLHPSSSNDETTVVQKVDVALPKTMTGFSLRSFATDALAHDIHCLAIGPNDEVFVSGPGYLRQLLDTDADGVADKFEPANFQPRQGAQGLLVERDQLWVVADRAIWRVPRAAGQSASKWLELPKTGGEHDFHSLRRGSDGWLYFLAGNQAQIDRDFVTSPLPIPEPQAGVVGRISPDGQVRQVLVHGMRNAYDFALDLDGSFLVYDSDDERDAGLPWYRPTTLFSAAEGTDIGWVSRCFKKPEGTLGSASIRAETGRGSPTGVAVQRGAAWGAAYFGGVVFADWTFGRVYLQPRTPESKTLENKTVPPTVLVESHAGAAFAPTSLSFDSQGRLWIATGGRNTTGAVYVVERDAAAIGEQEVHAVEEVAAWFASLESVPSVATAGTGSNHQDSALATWENVAQRQTKFTELLQNLAPFCSSLVREDWRQAGQRALVRTYVLREAKAWESVTRRAELRRQVTALNPHLWPEVVTWLAMSGIELSQEEFSFASLGPSGDSRQLVAVAMQGDEPLSQTIRMSTNAPSSEHLARATLALAVLAHRDSPLNESAELPRIAGQLFAAELQRAAKERATQLSWADWFLIWRWTLRSPALGDGQTGPWDFMKCEQEFTPDPLTQQAIADGLEAVWQDLLTRDSATESAANSQPTRETTEQGTTLTSASEPWQRLLEIQLLLRIDLPSLPQRWQVWFELQERANARETKDSNDWHPVRRTYAMVLLAAMPKPWPEAVTEKVSDYLLNIDQQLIRWNISTDRNWQQRFEELGSLLCLEHPRLIDLLTNASQWQRATQIPLVSFLPVEQQITAVRKLLLAAPQWETRRIESSSLDTLVETVELWKLHENRLANSADISRQVLELIANVRAEQNQFFTQQQPALSDTELAQALEFLEKNVVWEQGDSARGKMVYERRNCLLCHGQNGRLGPALAGVSRRFQRRDVLTVILHPDSRITDRYQPLWIEKTDGTLLIGRPIYESTDGVLLEDQQGKTWQLKRDEIESSRPSPRSLMPSGLMADASPQDWADLWAYLITQ